LKQGCGTGQQGFGYEQQYNQDGYVQADPGGIASGALLPPMLQHEQQRQWRAQPGQGAQAAGAATQQVSDVPMQIQAGATGVPVQHHLLPAAAAGPHGTPLVGNLQQGTAQLGYGRAAAPYLIQGGANGRDQPQLQQQQHAPRHVLQGGYQLALPYIPQSQQQQQQ
jgi:hypothetical protein